MEEAQGNATGLMCIPVEAGGSRRGTQHPLGSSRAERGTRTSLRGAEQHFSLIREMCAVILGVKLTEVITVF